MSRFANYDANAVTLVLCGIPITDMRAPKGFLKLSKAADEYGTSEGTDGGVIRWHVGSRLCDGEVTLLDGSLHNQQLSALLAVDTLSTNGAGVSILLAKDNNGATLVASDKCWISKRPETAKGRESGERTWKFQFVANNAQFIDGGN